jgi:hypothetical protein
MKTKQILQLTVFLTLIITQVTSAQPFTEINVDMLNVAMSSVGWGDYDNDGDLDIILIGRSGDYDTYNSIIYRNDGNGVFCDIEAGLVDVSDGSVAWGDYDNDGDLDILISGYYWDGNNNVITKIYRNDENNNFTDINSALIGVYFSSAQWGDYDNDGDLDILLSGYDINSNSVVTIYRNDGNETFTDVNPEFQIVQGSCTSADYDNDGDLDILLNNVIYRNDENFIFTSVSTNLLDLPGGYFTAWGDYDSDGDIDVLILGRSGDDSHTKIYQNNGDGEFSDIDANLENVSYGTAAWGDYDNDGDLDILVSGNQFGSGGSSNIYRNDENVFTDIQVDLTGGCGNEIGGNLAAWGDYDNDGDLDIVLTGGDDLNDFNSVIFRNDINISNTTPAITIGLSSIQEGNSIVLSWDKSTDNETSQDALTYNVYLGTQPSDINIISPMSDINNGFRKIPAYGNTCLTNSLKINNLSVATYYWSVQTIDNAFAGSPFSIEASFIVYPSAPIANDVTSCFGEITPDLEAIGENIRWFSDSELSNLLFIGNIFPTGETNIGTYTYYVTQTVNGFESPSTIVKLTIGSIPFVSIADSTNISCYGYSDGSATVTASEGTPPYYYLWDDDNNTTEPYVSGLSANTAYQVTITDNNGCSTVTGVTLTEPEPLNIISEYSEIICLNSDDGYIDISVSGGTSPYFYSWSNGATTEDIENLEEDEYIVNVTDNNDCTETVTFNITSIGPYQDEEICLVTVNETNRNIIIWEETPGKGIVSYNIYRETIEPGIYELIGSIPFDSLSIFVDTTSHANQRSYQYKLAITDTCGNESEQSYYHRTMLLQVSVGIGAYNLNWSEYEYEGGGFTFSRYRIYRGESLENLEIIDSIGANYFTYIDNNPPEGLLFYQVAGVNPDGCFPAKMKKSISSENYTLSFTNVEDNGDTEISDINYLNRIKIYPNPFTNKTLIEFPNPNLDNYKLIITHISGKTVRIIESIKTNKVEFEKGVLSEGFYLIELRGEKVYRGRFIIN